MTGDPTASSAFGPLLCVFLVLVFGGAITYTVFWIKFLVNDKGKGGSCADSECYDVWLYAIISTCLAWVASQNKDKDGKVKQDFQSAVTLANLIYGGIVLIGNKPCDQCKNTGIYQLMFVMYIIQLSVTGLIIIMVPVVIGCMAKSGNLESAANGALAAAAAAAAAAPTAAPEESALTVNPAADVSPASHQG
jgi:hypothetical protein